MENGIHYKYYKKILDFAIFMILAILKGRKKINNFYFLFCKIVYNHSKTCELYTTKYFLSRNVKILQKYEQLLYVFR